MGAGTVHDDLHAFGERRVGVLPGFMHVLAVEVQPQLCRAGLIGQFVELAQDGTVHRQHGIGPLQHPEVDPDGAVVLNVVAGLGPRTASRS
jgi:hypothetical protein